MDDARLNSAHLLLSPRREQYRQAREALLGARGWLTLGAERLQALVRAGDDSSALLPGWPDRVLPGTRFLLVDHQAGWAHVLKPGINSIGRFNNNDIVLDGPMASRRHCVLLVHARGTCELHDTASRNGTFVNGRRVEAPVRLTSGDWLRLSSRLLLFVNERDYRAAYEDESHPATLCE
jgi:hypothetical protein